ncbi:RNA polymerase II mediator complex subunit [Kalmusia sp. IMI 367209]|nr:RNA polymerase II mediator complex subunit [Kalmusia sp. IMI 367209]
MADILTQIQDELDMLLNQMQSSFAYIRLRAPPANIPGQPLLSTFAEFDAQNAAQNTQNTSQTASQPQPTAPPTQEEFQKDIQELSKDMVLKEQQIEVLIASLPGLNTSEQEQVQRMKELERELEEIEGERLAAVKEKEVLLQKVEDRIVRAGAVR